MAEQPWTDEQIDRLARNLTWRAGGSTENAMRIGLRTGRSAWQADREGLLARIAELEKWRTEAHRLRDAIMQMNSGNLQQAESETDNG